jgi:hypothetical protein
MNPVAVIVPTVEDPAPAMYIPTEVWVAVTTAVA